jgi:hypothetical protein
MTFRLSLGGVTSHGGFFESHFLRREFLSTFESGILEGFAGPLINFLSLTY